MNESRERGALLAADDAERLLSGQAPGGADDELAGLVRLLVAAGEPLPCRAEDELAVLDAFRQVSAAGRPGDARRRGAAPLLAPQRSRRQVKALVGGVAAAFTLSGVAIAAQTGALPHPFHSGGTPHRRPAPPVTVSDTAPGANRPAGTAGPAAGSPAGRNPAAPTHPAHPTHPVTGSHADTDNHGLCESYTQAAKQGHQASVSIRLRLSQAAGGEAKVDSYCAAVIGAGTPTNGAGPKPKSTPTSTPTTTPSPSGSPSPAATTAPTPTAPTATHHTAAAHASASPSPSTSPAASSTGPHRH
ncbi:hypothetical protein [Actinacidiphila acididurans]|uniref:Uncharacterized protein n=1 Tax=Actinacidiphila acididurans TaxID=2784346 RepID=A0ABS2TZV5_9ACTN|nr:hypothetical protein [Actinacidiphila acididurans]MBM9508875.1 hypothetical protein [Actinacidiphila acididurans]